MYSKKHLKIAIDRPALLLSEANRLYHRRLRTANSNPNGVNFIEEKWDNLIILDACRNDIFREVADLPGKTESRQSLGTTTKEFITANFEGKHLYDTVYVSANVWYAKVRDDIDSDIFRFVKTERDAADGLSSHPKTVTEEAIKTYEKHPNKRLIVHYLQSHQPYLGDSAINIEHGNALRPTMKSNDISDRELREAYVNNLELALKELEPLLDTLTGRTVITGDHGELLGDKQRPFPVRDYGHPGGIYVDELATVPWHIIESGTREIVPADGPYANNKQEHEELDEHLKGLGYKM